MSTDRDVPLIWYAFSVIWYEYHWFGNYCSRCISITSTFYQMVLIWVVNLYQVKNIIRSSRMSSRIGYIQSVAFQLLSIVDILRCYGFITECCLNVYLYVCTDNIQNIDIGAQTTYKTLTSGLLVLVWVLILCMCRYLSGSDFWVPEAPP